MDRRRYCGINIDFSELACTTAEGAYLDSGAARGYISNVMWQKSN